jgi:hypothetical protein
MDTRRTRRNVVGMGAIDVRPGWAGRCGEVSNGGNGQHLGRAKAPQCLLRGTTIATADGTAKSKI